MGKDKVAKKSTASASDGSGSKLKKKKAPLDPRFDTTSDPRFRQMPKKDRKVKVDSRFKAMFSKEFAEPSAVDRTGRKMDSTSTMKNFYELEGAEEGDAESPTTIGDDRDETAFHWDQESSDDDSDGDIIIGEEQGQPPEVWDEDDAPKTEDVSRRLAVQNADWDNVSAEDIFMLFHGFLDGTGKNKKVEKVTIYPSDYGLEKLEYEKIHGPQIDGLKEDATDGNEDEEDMDAIRRYQRQRLKYHYAIVECNNEDTAVYLYDNLDGFNVEYIFPISVDVRFVPDEIEFPHEPASVCTSAPPGYQLPETAVQQAMRHSKVKCSWDEGDSKRSKMLTKNFSDKELANMDLQAYLASSSDEENGPGEQITEDNLESYRSKLLGGSDDEGDSDADDASQKENSDDDLTMTFNPALEQLAEDVKARALKAAGAGNLKKKGLDKKVLTPWEQYLEKKKKLKDQRRQERKELMAQQESADRFGKLKPEEGEESDDNILAKKKSKSKKAKRWDLSVDLSSAGKKKKQDEANAEDAADLELLMGEQAKKKHFDLNVKSQKKKKKAGLITDKEDKLKVDVQDNRLKKLFDDPDFAIDATNPEYKQTEGMASLIREKSKRRKEKQALSSKKVSESKKNGKREGDVDMNIFAKKKKKRKVA